MAESSFANVEYVVRTIAQTAVDNEKYFGDLDAVVGDGDFGIDRADIGTFLKKVALTITGRIGGTSGPIWGTAFIRAGTTAGTRTEVTADDAVAMLRAAIEGIKARGQSDVGDKTLLDALVPATDRLEAELRAGSEAQAALDATAAAAREQAEATRDMLAKRGRAAYTGERSIGTLDAGAIAVAVMAEQIAKGWSDRTTTESTNAPEEAQ